VIATQNFTDPGVVVMILVSTLAGIVVLLFAARWFTRRSTVVTVAKTLETGRPGPARAGAVHEGIE